MGRGNETNTLKYRTGITGFFSEFGNRIREEFYEIYEGGTSEGSTASKFFDKWGWYATLVDLANDDILKMDEILEMDTIETHAFLAHKADKAKLMASLRKSKGGNVTEL